jgi:hypothetical protein
MDLISEIWKNNIKISKIIIVLETSTFDLVEMYRRFGEFCCLHNWGKGIYPDGCR